MTVIKRVFTGQIVQYLNYNTKKIIEQQISGLERGKYFNEAGKELDPAETSAHFLNTPSISTNSLIRLDQLVKAIPLDAWPAVLARIAENLAPEEAIALFLQVPTGPMTHRHLDQIITSIPLGSWAAILTKVNPDVRRSLVRRLKDVSRV
jgi:hypothetical protein